jgi:hypothetical protein
MLAGWEREGHVEAAEVMFGSRVCVANWYRLGA